MQNFELRLVIVILKLVTWINRLDIWINNDHFNDHFLLFVPASVAADHKTATESDLLKSIAGVLKYTHDKIGAGVVER